VKAYTTYLSKARAIFATVLLVSSLVLSAQVPSHEYQLKAAFLFNFTQFVEWPGSSFATDDAPWVIGVLGENPFNTYLEEIVSGEKINGHRVTVNYYKNTDEIKSCHILYINLPDAKKQELALAGLEKRNILTVSDFPSFPQYGGMIRLFTRDNKIKIQVNLEASKAANLVISSKLLKLAEIFTPGKNN
jgi:hypothetical protein